MSKKDKVLNLMGFLMDLLEDEKPSEPKGLFGQQGKFDLNTTKSIKLMELMADKDRERATDLRINRKVMNETKTLRQQLDEMRNQGYDNATEAKKEEELEFILPEVEDKMGVTVENGKLKLVKVPPLRDNIPLGDENDALIGISVKNEDGSELKGVGSLPQAIQDKLNSLGNNHITEPSTNVSSAIPEAIKQAMINNPIMDSDSMSDVSQIPPVAPTENN